MSIDPPNPYKSPNFSDPPMVYGAPNPSGMNPGILTQQRVISILMLVHGILLLLVGIALLIAAIIMPTVIAADMNRANAPPNQQEIAWFLGAMYGGMSLAALVPGGLQIFAGVRNLWLKGRVLGMVAMGVGMLSAFTCYCFPSAVGLFI